MQVEVEILVQTITAQYGVLSQGDILRTSPEFAAHLVDDCGAAKYCKPRAAALPQSERDATSETTSEVTVPATEHPTTDANGIAAAAKPAKPKK